MKRVCCVCKKYLGEVPGPKDAVTHGFCEPCLKIYMAEMEADFEKIDKAHASPTHASPTGYAGQEACNKKDKSCVAGGEAG